MLYLKILATQGLLWFVLEVCIKYFRQNYYYYKVKIFSNLQGLNVFIGIIVAIVWIWSV